MRKLSETYNLVVPPKIGQLVEGKIVGKEATCVFVDLGPMGTGIIRGREYYEIRDQLKKELVPGKTIMAKVIDIDEPEGFIELSFAKANQELVWEELQKRKDSSQPFVVKILAANKGGLLTKVEGLDAFLPVSQLALDKYPKVENADPNKILQELQKFVGKEIEVVIFSLDPKQNQIILSERLKELGKKKELLSQLKEGQIVQGKITAICDFGAFISFEVMSPEGKKALVEGLIHISELDWQLVEDPAEIVKVGQEIKAKILQIKQDKVFLSLKALKTNPWEGIEEKIKKGQIIKGKVLKFNPYGAFIQVLPKVQALCHVSEWGSRKKMEESLKIGKTYEFVVLNIDPANYKLILGWPNK